MEPGALWPDGLAVTGFGQVPGLVDRRWMPRVQKNPLFALGSDLL
jgi:hypothetical protein